MPHDPIRIADTKAWLAKAENDLRGAAIDLAAAPPLPEDAVCHCQQAAEKALKAFPTWHDQPFRKTHDLVEVGQQCVQVDSSLEPLCRRASRLTAFAWIFRYPGSPPAPSRKEIEQALSLAREVCESVSQRLPDECRP